MVLDSIKSVDQNVQELLNAMRIEENKYTLTPNFQAAYLPHRTGMIQLLKAQARKLRADSKITFLALAYMDSTLSKADIKEEGLQLIVTCCLYLASKLPTKIVVKYFEHNDKIPPIKTMKRLIGGDWTLNEIRKCELKILGVLGYSLNFLTALEFASLFLYTFHRKDPSLFETELNQVTSYLNAAYSGIAGAIQ
eukprot:TRINITY_DN16568_c0_g1_i1.p1 TRINITY_DN16568_c0_g1~~TRINITY_DN16568_c0_g1_i1.p1  ORF type:complete len:194 (-),score=22.58 TRINITY_DN16568_c0_g1_i1:184-765(-)